jgi:hypothetical protein
MISPEPGQDALLPGIDSGPALRAVLAALPGHCVAGVFAASDRPLVYSRHHWLRYKGEYRVRADLRAALEAVRSRPPAEWDDEEADLVLTLYALDTASVGLDDLHEYADSASVRRTLTERHALYAGVAAPGEAPPGALTDLAHRISGLRPLVQRTHELYSVIDGRAWYRTEGVIDHADLDSEHAAPSVAAELAALGAGPTTASAYDLIRTAVRRAVAVEGESASVVRALMRAALADPLLRGDHVTVTCPMGLLLDHPEEMTSSEAFFTETQLRDGVELADYAERLGHESTEQVQRTIKARMLKLKRGAIRSLYGPGCLQGQFVEKHGGHMIFRNEDAHYRGHQSIGCSSGGRAAIALRYRSEGAERELTSMVGDFRVVRMSQDERDTFAAHELPQVIRYGEWLRTAVEETYRLGAVIRVDTPAPGHAPAGTESPTALPLPV